MQKRQEPAAFPLRRVLVSVGVGLMLTLMLALLAAILIERETLPQSGVRIYALCAGFLGSVAGGFCAARSGKLPAALLTAALMLGVLLAMGGAVLGGMFDGSGLLALCGVLFGGAFCGTALSGLLR